MPKSKIHIIIDMVAKILGTVIYIILKKTSEAETFLIIKNSFNTIATIFVDSFSMNK